MPDIAVLGIDVDSRSVLPASAALDKLTAAATKTGPAVDKVGQASKSAAPEIERVATASTKAATATEGLGGNVGRTGSVFQRFGPQIQQAGYQVGDFAVQVASGGSAIVAFTQQGAQLAGMFGPAGAVFGAVIGIGGAIAATLIPALIGSGDAADGAIGKFLAYTDGLDKARKGAEDLAKAIGGLSDAQLKQQIAESEATRGKQAKGTQVFVRGAGIISIGPNGIRSSAQAQQVDPEQVRLEARLKEEEAARARADRRLGPAPGDEGRPTAESRREDARLRAARAAGADPFAAQRRSQSLYPAAPGDQSGYESELNARVKADHDKKVAADKAEATRLASEAKARADHAKTIAKSLEDMTVAANDNAAAMTKQQAAIEAAPANSIGLEAAQKQMRIVQDQVQIETQLRRYRGDASVEAVQQARTALQAQAEAKRAAEEALKLKQDQAAWDQKIAQGKRDEQFAEAEKQRMMQEQAAGMQLDQQRQKIDENRAAFVSYGQVAFDALSQVAIGGEKANVALGNLLKTWANMAAQAASQMLLRALSTALFPQATGTAAAFGGGDVYAHQAAGGDSEPGRTYIVGEHGRERFTPWTKGRVEPMGKGKGGGQTIAVNTTNNISLSGSATNEDGERMARAIDKKFNETIDARLARHARSGGAFAA